MPAALPRSARLSAQHQFTKVFESGVRSSDRHFTLLGYANDRGDARIGLAISRKAARRAVARNRLKRLARETFRQHQGDLAGIDVVVMARPGAESQDNRELRASLERHCTELARRCDTC